jgi:hypothetical protein
VAIEAFAADRVRFADGTKEGFDSFILATDFQPDLRTLLADAPGVMDAAGKPLVSNRESGEPGLYFIDAIAVPTRQFGRLASAPRGSPRTRIAVCACSGPHHAHKAYWTSSRPGQQSE